MMTTASQTGNPPRPRSRGGSGSGRGRSWGQRLPDPRGRVLQGCIGNGRERHGQRGRGGHVDGRVARLRRVEGELRSAEGPGCHVDRSRRQRRRHEEGVASVEKAVVVLALAAVVPGVAQCGRKRSVASWGEGDHGSGQRGLRPEIVPGCGRIIGIARELAIEDHGQNSLIRVWRQRAHTAGSEVAERRALHRHRSRTGEPIGGIGEPERGGTGPGAGHRRAVWISIENEGCRWDTSESPEIQGLRKGSLAEFQVDLVRRVAHCFGELTRTALPSRPGTRIQDFVGDRTQVKRLTVPSRRQRCCDRQTPAGGDAIGVEVEIQGELDESLSGWSVDVAIPDGGLSRPCHRGHRGGEVRTPQTSVGRTDRGSRRCYPSGPKGAGNNAERHEDKSATQRSHNGKEAP